MFTRDTVREYVSGALWVMPAAATLVSLGVGLGIAQIQISLDSPWAPLAFQGTADDARSVLAIISSTVVTVIALVLGLTVVALQLASTQFSLACCATFCVIDPLSWCSAYSSGHSLTARLASM